MCGSSNLKLSRPKKHCELLPWYRINKSSLPTACPSPAEKVGYSLFFIPRQCVRSEEMYHMKNHNKMSDCILLQLGISHYTGQIGSACKHNMYSNFKETCWKFKNRSHPSSCRDFDDDRHILLLCAREMSVGQKGACLPTFWPKLRSPFREKSSAGPGPKNVDFWARNPDTDTCM